MLSSLTLQHLMGGLIGLVITLGVNVGLYWRLKVRLDRLDEQLDPEPPVIDGGVVDGSHPHAASPFGFNRRAFSLVEILIVLVILSILAAVVIPQFTAASDHARASREAVAKPVPVLCTCCQRPMHVHEEPSP